MFARSRCCFDRGPVCRLGSRGHLRAIAVAVLVLTTGPFVVVAGYARTAIPTPLERAKLMQQCVDESQHVVCGKVLSKTGFLYRDDVYTRIDMRVLRNLKGRLGADSTLTFAIGGGVVGNRSVGRPYRFEADSTYLVFTVACPPFPYGRIRDMSMVARVRGDLAVVHVPERVVSTVALLDSIAILVEQQTPEQQVAASDAVIVGNVAGIANDEPEGSSTNRSGNIIILPTAVYRQNGGPTIVLGDPLSVEFAARLFRAEASPATVAAVDEGDSVITFLKWESGWRLRPSVYSCYIIDGDSATVRAYACRGRRVNVEKQPLSSLLARILP